MLVFWRRESSWQPWPQIDELCNAGVPLSWRGCGTVPVGPDVLCGLPVLCEVGSGSIGCWSNGLGLFRPCKNRVSLISITASKKDSFQVGLAVGCPSSLILTHGQTFKVQTRDGRGLDWWPLQMMWYCWCLRAVIISSNWSGLQLSVK